MKSMYLISSLVTLSCSAAIAAQSEGAQDPRMRQGMELTTNRYNKLSNLLDAKLRLETAMDRRAGDQPAEGDAEAGENADAAALEDLVVDGRGAIRYAIVEIDKGFTDDGKTVAVPFEKLEYRGRGMDDKGVFALKTTTAELERRPAIDLDQIKKGDLKRLFGDVGTTGEAVEHAEPEMGEHEDAGEDEGHEATEAAARSAELVLASELLGVAVWAGGEEFGNIGESFVVTSASCVDYVVVNHGGVIGIGEESYLVPMGALEPIMKDGERTFRLEKTATQMESAPKYEEPDTDGVVLDFSQARRASEFYGVSFHDHGKSRETDKGGMKDSDY